MPNERDTERLARELAKTRNLDPDEKISMHLTCMQGSPENRSAGFIPALARWEEFSEEARTLLIQRVALAAFVTGQKSVEDKSKHPNETYGTTAYRNSPY